MKKLLVSVALVLVSFAFEAYADAVSVSLAHSGGLFRPYDTVALVVKLANSGATDVSYAFVCPETPDKKKMREVAFDSALGSGIIEAGKEVEIPVNVKLPDSGYYNLRFVAIIQGVNGESFESYETLDSNKEHYLLECMNGTGSKIVYVNTPNEEGTDMLSGPRYECPVSYYIYLTPDNKVISCDYIDNSNKWQGYRVQNCWGGNIWDLVFWYIKEYNLSGEERKAVCGLADAYGVKDVPKPKDTAEFCPLQ